MVKITSITKKREVQYRTTKKEVENILLKQMYEVWGKKESNSFEEFCASERTKAPDFLNESTEMLFSLIKILEGNED